jgi:hypothetical protein
MRRVGRVPEVWAARPLRCLDETALRAVLAAFHDQARARLAGVEQIGARARRRGHDWCCDCRACRRDDAAARRLCRDAQAALLWAQEADDELRYLERRRPHAERPRRSGASPA